MPNIEVHGFQRDEANVLRDRIFDTFKAESFVEEVVVTIYSTLVTDVKNCSQPFLRVVSTPCPHVEMIIEKLKTWSIDVEVMKLESFIPKSG